MVSFRIKRKYYTKYDDTDSLKAMKDSDILAQKKRELPMSETYGKALTSATAGAATGAIAGGLLGGISGLASKNPGGFGGRMAAAGSRLKTAGKFGLAAGALLGTVSAVKSIGKKKSDQDHYNRRLEYAQRHARRREKKDWKTNMTQRDGYSY